VRKWQQVGLVSESPVEKEKGKAREKVGLGVLDLANSTATSGAEVPIPVFVDISNTVDTAPSQQIGQGAVDPQKTSQKTSVPVISITKPPAPLPVDLPTHDEITPPSLDFEVHPDDIESTGALMREISHHSRTASEVSNPGHQRNPLGALQSTHNAVSGDATPPSSVPTTSQSRVADLLADSEPAFSASQMNPSSSARPSPRVIPPPLLLTDERTPIEDHESDSEGEELPATVRLVGSGSDIGLADSQGQLGEAGDGRAEAEAAPSASYSSNGAPLPVSRNSRRKGTSVHSLRGGQSAE